MDSLVLIFNTVLDGMGTLWGLMTSSLILAIPIVFFILRKVVRFFKYIT